MLLLLRLLSALGLLLLRLSLLPLLLWLLSALRLLLLWLGLPLLLLRLLRTLRLRLLLLLLRLRLLLLLLGSLPLLRLLSTLRLAFFLPSGISLLIAIALSVHGSHRAEQQEDPGGSNHWNGFHGSFH